jgi:putative addiction module component (TIGR02574 family)
MAGDVRQPSFREEELETAWDEEIERRIREIDSGAVQTIPWEEVRARLHARLDRKA